MLQNLQERLERKKVLFLFWEFGSFWKNVGHMISKRVLQKSQISGTLASDGFPTRTL